jgi:hypothetical protein
MHLKCYNNSGGQFLQCPFTQDETSVIHLTPERKEKQPRGGNIDHLPQQPNSLVISKKDNSNRPMGPQISASGRFP